MNILPLFPLSVLLLINTVFAYKDFQFSVIQSNKGPRVELANSQVYYHEGSLYVGEGLEGQGYTEPLILSMQDPGPDGVTPVGGGSYTPSWAPTPTAWQDLWLFESQTKPPGFTSPHSASVPYGASINGFQYVPKRGLTFKGKRCWSIVETQKKGLYQIYWNGAEKVGIKVRLVQDGDYGYA